MALYQNDAVSVNIGERLRELREARNISMRTLAARSGLSANALSVIERGKASPSVSTLYKLADALGSRLQSFLKPTSSASRLYFLSRTRGRMFHLPAAYLKVWAVSNLWAEFEPFMLTLGEQRQQRSAEHDPYRARICLLSAWGAGIPGGAPDLSPGAGRQSSLCRPSQAQMEKLRQNCCHSHHHYFRV